MDKHTPGPWHVEVTASAINVDSDMGGVAQVFGAENPDDETMPNARLIAASPRLLAIAIECERLLADFDQAADEDNEAWSEERKALEELRSVIKEATGQ